jgi:hypothetical protein
MKMTSQGFLLQIGGKYYDYGNGNL